MHDPKTVAHELKIFGQWIITLWHVDPEIGGSDDSCGWFSPPMGDKENRIIRDMVDWDSKFPFYSSQSVLETSVIEDPNYSYPKQGVGDCMGYIAAAWQDIAWKREKRSNLSNDELWEVVTLSANPHDNLRAVLADRDSEPLDRVERFLRCVMRAYLRHHRPWYRHPRWHVKHWEIQVHPVQSLKRWLFSRCASCGKRFPLGYAPVTDKWHGSGPLWFRNESDIYHHECIRRKSN